MALYPERTCLSLHGSRRPAVASQLHPRSDDARKAGRRPRQRHGDASQRPAQRVLILGGTQRDTHGVGWDLADGEGVAREDHEIKVARIADEFTPAPGRWQSQP